MNRSTLYEFLRNNSELEPRYTKIGRGNYPVFRVPYIWEHSYLLINNSRVTDFQALILFSKELVVRFSIHNDWQINIPYKDIEHFEVRDDLDIGYMYLHDDKKKYHEED